MTKSPITKLFLVTLLLLASISFASADISVSRFDHDLELTPPVEETRVCSCGSTSDVYTLTNKGLLKATFNIALDASEDWITLGMDKVVLDAGESVQIPIQIAPNCGAERNTEYAIYVNSHLGRYRVIDRPVTVNTCQAILFEVTSLDRVVSPCEDARYEIEVTNTATFSETYRLFASEDVVLTESVLTLGPGKSATVFATQRNTCDFYGDKDVSFTLRSEKTDQERTVVEPLSVLWDYEFEINMDQQDKVCAETQTTRTAVIKNTGYVANEYTLSLSSDVATLSHEHLSLDVGEEAEVYITYDPAESQVGNSETTLTVSTKLGDNTKSRTVSTLVEDCYEHTVVVNPPSNTLCAGEGTFSVQVQNRGFYTETFDLAVDGDIFAEFAETQIELAPGEHKDVELTVNAPDRDEEYVVNVLVTQTPGITSVTDVPVTAVSNAACTLITPTTTEVRMYTEDTLVPVILENEGIKASNYNFVLDGTIFELDEFDAFLAPDEQVVLHFRKGEDVKPGKYIEKLIVVSDTSQYRYDFVVKVKKKGFLTSLYEQAKFGKAGFADWCIILMILLAVLVLVTLFIMLFRSEMFHLPHEIADNKPLILGALIIIFALCLLGAFFEASENTVVVELDEDFTGSDYANLFHEFPQNTDYNLDLSKYFADPDNDELSFSSSPSENLRIRFNGDVAEITPKRGWSGYESIVLTAEDAAGATVDSPVMTVHVVKTKPLTFTEYLSAHCAAINWLLVAFFVLLMVIVVYFYPERKRATPFRAPEPPAKKATGKKAAKKSTRRKAAKKSTRTAAAKELYVANKTGSKCHRATCTLVERIPKGKRLTFSTKAQAIKGGYSSCKLCRAFDQ